MTARTLKYVPLDELRGHPDNPKNHLGELIGASIDRFGYVEPQVLDERTGLLAAGHGRLDELRAKQAAGAEVPDGIRVVKGRWLVPVVHGWSSADDAEALAYLVASNESTIAGGWDLPQLSNILDDLAHTEVGLDGTGYNPARLDLLLAEMEQSPELGPTDPNAEWVGMPAFQQEDRTAAYSTTVHFLNQEDAARFWSEVLVAEGPRRTAWWPKHDGFDGSSLKQQYVAD